MCEPFLSITFLVVHEQSAQVVTFIINQNLATPYHLPSSHVESSPFPLGLTIPSLVQISLQHSLLQAAEASLRCILNSLWGSLALMTLTHLPLSLPAVSGFGQSEYTSAP